MENDTVLYNQAGNSTPFTLAVVLLKKIRSAEMSSLEHIQKNNSYVVTGMGN